MRGREGALSPFDQEGRPSSVYPCTCFGLPSFDFRTWMISMVNRASFQLSLDPSSPTARLLERIIRLPSLFSPLLYSAHWVGRWAPPLDQNQFSPWSPLCPVSTFQQLSAPHLCLSFHGILCQCFLSSLTSRCWGSQCSVLRHLPSFLYLLSETISPRTMY